MNAKLTSTNNFTLQVGVKILLKNKAGKYLLLRRSEKKYPDISNRWDIVGGRIDPGKPLLENLKREVEEETGLKLLDGAKLAAAQDILRNQGQHIVRLTYIGKASGKFELDTNENDEYKWYSWDELVKLKDLDIYFKELIKKGIIKK